MEIEIERRLAISELLTQPDPPEMRRRAHHLTYAGKPERYELVALLSAAFVQSKLLALHESAEERNAALVRIDAVASPDRTLRAIQAVAA
jgi:hypothetical protein